ncbi:MAG: alpha-galactosidase/6-phospho-beta-glucosidase family protein [Colwellia sp.]
MLIAGGGSKGAMSRIPMLVKKAERLFQVALNCLILG